MHPLSLSSPPGATMHLAWPGQERDAWTLVLAGARGAGTEPGKGEELGATEAGGPILGPATVARGRDTPVSYSLTMT